MVGVKTKKRRVGTMSRKDLFAILERAVELAKGEAVIHTGSCRGNKYELRAKRWSSGVSIEWAAPGTFYDTPGYKLVTT